MRSMSRRERAARPFLPGPSPERTSRGLGVVPVAPSFLDLEQEETVAYDSAVSLPALLAEARRSVVANEEAPQAPPTVLATTTSEIRQRNESFHSSPHFPEETHPHTPVESNLHHVGTDAIHDSLVPSAPQLEVVELRVGVSSHSPARLFPALVKPRERRRRSRLATLVVSAIVLGVALLVTIELSSIANLPWLDPRPLFTKSFEAVKTKIPWDRLPHLPKL
jgi:hypothetical protein